MRRCHTARSADRVVPVLALALLAGCGRAAAPAIDAPTVASSAPPSLTTTAPAENRPGIDPRCRSRVSGIVDYEQGAVGTSDPLVEAREWADVSYPDVEPVVAFEDEDEDELEVVVSTADQGVLAILHFVSDDRGGWLLDMTTACTDPPAASPSAVGP